MHILLIGNTETSDDAELYYDTYVDFFTDSIATTDTEITVSKTFFDDLFICIGDDSFTIFDTRSNQDVAKFDAVLIRGKGFRNYFDVVRAISRYAVRHNIPVINDYSGFRDSSKLAQALQFFEQDIPVSASVFMNQAVLTGKAALPFSYPCIMKATFGAHGNDNYLIHSLEEMNEKALASPELHFVIQRFVPNDNDYRILVIGDQAIVISREAVDGSHLNNTSQGGSAYLVPNEHLPARVIADSIKIARHLDMTFAGVDVLADKNTGEYYFLEVNSQPQLMSGAFIDEKKKLVGAYLASLARV